MTRKRSGLTIVPRDNWLAYEPIDTSLLADYPPQIVLVVFTNTDPCLDDLSCSQTLKDLQREHMGDKSHDIKWNFMIGGNGKVYEGRGWKFNAEKDLEYSQYDHKSIDIAYIGRPNENHVTPIMKEALEQLVKHGIELTDIAQDPDYVFYEEHKGFQG